MEPEGSLPHSQVPATCPYPEPNRPSPCPHIAIPEDPSSYYPPIYAWVFQVFKIHKIKNHSDMFRIVCDPSSESVELYLTEIRSGSLMFVVWLVGVWQCNFEPVVCVCVCVWYDGLRALRPSYHTRTHKHTTVSKLRCQTPTKHTTNVSEPP